MVRPDEGLDFSSCPSIFILPAHLQAEGLHETEDLIFQLGGPLTYNPTEARLFLGRISQKKRAALELRVRGVWTEEAPTPAAEARDGDAVCAHRDPGPARKKAKVTRHEDSQTRRETRQTRQTRQTRKQSSPSPSTSASTSSAPADQGPDVTASSRALPSWPDLSGHVLVLSLSWIETCVTQKRFVPFKPYLIYSGRLIPKPEGKVSPKQVPNVASSTPTARARPDQSTSPSKPVAATTIRERAKAEAAQTPTASGSSHYARRRFGDYQKHAKSPTSPRASRPRLHRTSTSEYEELVDHPLPPLPDWATGPHASYACCRSTPLHTANVAFIAQMAKIKDARILTLDEIGVRAYSTAIASVAAYPHPIRHAQEIMRLPGCSDKIAALWDEWYHSADDDADRFLQTVRDIDNDPDLQHLRLFWNVWGVGPDTARKFYYDLGWQDLDDVVEFGWTTLTRVQQIGLKFYDDFLTKIPRRDVEEIRDIILRHTRAVLAVAPAQEGTADDVECIIVGGYRRGKAESGDVDIVLSHRDHAKTQDLVVDVVRSLEDEGWVTHTLALHTTTSDRGQATLPYRSAGKGHGFDTLDKALCVWQDPHFPPAADATEDGPPPKNPNIHRRVDIIISPWRTVGCAVLGWSGGTTFQRDIRRFVTKTRGLKFDSSGVRDRANGLVLDLEGPRPRTADGLQRTLKGQPQPPRQPNQGDEHDPGVEWDDEDTWQARERRLMDGLGFGYRQATERCTG